MASRTKEAREASQSLSESQIHILFFTQADKGQVPPEIPFGRVGHLGDQIFHVPGAKLWHFAAELRTLSFTYPLCGSALTNTTDNPSEMCPPKLKYFCLCLYHCSYKIIQGPHIPPMAFASCHDRGSNLLPPDRRASTLTTQPVRLAAMEN